MPRRATIGTIAALSGLRLAACVTGNRAISANRARSVGSSVRERALPNRVRRCACSPNAFATSYTGDLGLVTPRST